MNTDELSTGGGSPSAKSKKREGEKRTSPCTPLREKGKGKEHRRGSWQNRLSRARVDCLPYGSQSSSQSGYKYIPSSQTTPARARTCEAHAAIRIPRRTFFHRLKKVKIFFHA